MAEGISSREGAHRRYPGWIDAPYAEDAQVPALAGVLAEYCALSPLRPVTGPNRSEAQQTAALEIALRSGRGVGVRVHMPGEWHDGTVGAVLELLKSRPGVHIDLLLDLGSVLPGRLGAGKEALRALDVLVPLAPWRTTAVLGGGFPGHGRPAGGGVPA
ncbi:hypothetical protein NKH18_38660 [Streptomyces sp. M10(2022)]